MANVKALHVSFERAKRGCHTSSLSDMKLGQKWYSHKWEIGNFEKKMSWDSGNYIDSPIFNIKTKKCDSEWTIKLYPNGNGEDNVGYISLYLENKSFEPEEDDICVSIAFTILDADGCVALRQELNPSTFTRTVSTWGWPRVVQSSVLSDRGLLVHDILSLLTEITLVGGDVIVGGNGSSMKDQDDAAAICRLSTDIESMFDTGRFSDCIIACGGREFPCHKFILSARSSVFDAMFSHDMREHVQNRVDIEDLDAKVVLEMIKYIYSGQVTELDFKAADLLTAAEKYDLEELKNMCVTNLCNSIRNDNVLDMLVLVETYDLPELRKSALEFAAVHKKEVVNQGNWRAKLENYPGIIADIYEYDAKNM